MFFIMVCSVAETLMSSVAVVVPYRLELDVVRTKDLPS